MEWKCEREGDNFSCILSIIPNFRSRTRIVEKQFQSGWLLIAFFKYENVQHANLISSGFRGRLPDGWCFRRRLEDRCCPHRAYQAARSEPG